MKSSNFLHILLAAAVAAKSQPQPQPEFQAVDATPSLPNVTPPTPLPVLDSPNGHTNELDTRQLGEVEARAPQPDPLAHTADAAIATTVPDQWTQRSAGTIGLGTLTARGATKNHQVRSEGTLGQTPWIGMAIGLTCTTLAAVMLG
ncbi:hypothetical protein PHISCL_07045 [Aspergillus sclerotialis]|uniref:GPI anchored protein n=1 Tax=Aspergillus sclerotialis TaxID=2070753 RepID=A0A3A2ZBX3_9EURO|nr:hypothetical protein PHISCL_07045 [Aspergillus sclerotialis]